MRSSTIHFLIIWLCLLSFGMDLAAHSIIQGPWASSNAHHRHAEPGAADHHQAPGFAQSETPLLDLSPAEHLNHHTQPLQNDRPTDTDHDETHHLSIQLRYASQFGATFYHFKSYSAQSVLFNTTAITPLTRAPERSVLRDLNERLRTVKITV